MSGCGRCHECGSRLVRGGDSSEWCDECGRFKYYESHAYVHGVALGCPSEHELDAIEETMAARRASVARGRLGLRRLKGWRNGHDWFVQYPQRRVRPVRVYVRVPQGWDGVRRGGGVCRRWAPALGHWLRNPMRQEVGQ